MWYYSPVHSFELEWFWFHEYFSREIKIGISITFYAHAINHECIMSQVIVILWHLYYSWNKITFDMFQINKYNEIIFDTFSNWFSQLNVSSVHLSNQVEVALKVVSVSATHAVDHGFAPRSVHTNFHHIKWYKLHPRLARTRKGMNLAVQPR